MTLGHPLASIFSTAMSVGISEGGAFAVAAKLPSAVHTDHPGLELALVGKRSR